jgi:hypothetical protein
MSRSADRVIINDVLDWMMPDERDRSPDEIILAARKCRFSRRPDEEGRKGAPDTGQSVGFLPAGAERMRTPRETLRGRLKRAVQLGIFRGCPSGAS